MIFRHDHSNEYSQLSLIRNINFLKKDNEIIKATPKITAEYTYSQQHSECRVSDAVILVRARRH